MIPVILACVTSLDGRITRHGEDAVHHWTSPEDQQYFADLIHAHSAIIMGRRTYEVVRDRIRLSKEHERYVLTRTPERFQAERVPSQLEFTNEDPKTLLQRLEQRGHRRALLAGGAALSKIFFEARCITEVWITLEPRIFGSGHPLLEETRLDIQLQLLEIKPGNEQGTLFLRYRVDSPRL
jgi:dihydrofolate reductase